MSLWPPDQEQITNEQVIWNTHVWAFLLVINFALIVLVSLRPLGLSSTFTPRSFPTGAAPFEGNPRSRQLLADFYLSFLHLSRTQDSELRTRDLGRTIHVRHKLGFQFHYFCPCCFRLFSLLLLLLLLAVLPLFAVNIYVLFCDIISKYFPILLNSLTREGSGRRQAEVRCRKWLAKFWPTFVWMKVMGFCVSFNLFCSKCCVSVYVRTN